MLVLGRHLLYLGAIASALGRDPGLDVTPLPLSALDVPGAGGDPGEIDVVVVDCRGAGLVDLGIALAGRWPQAATVAVTDIDDDLAVRRVLDLGCTGLVATTSAVEDLAAAISRVATGQLTMPAKALRMLMTSDRSEPTIVDLTARERDVLLELVDGRSNAEIARTLSLSTNTVRNHVHSVLGKLGAHSKLEAAAIAVRLDLAHPRREPRKLQVQRV